MQIEDFFKIINCDFYTGVPDSQLKTLCDYLMNKYGIHKRHHIIAVNEGNADLWKRHIKGGTYFI